ncbi:MAG: aldo/keto reductase [Candidatus Eisenbacteria bacterium]|nr:aldo/keto reductase [Candidatus Eisenbacteria bacterium]
MRYRPLGHSGLMVSELSLGSWTTLGGSIGVDGSAPIVRRAFDLGVNLFDTADVYVKGGAEEALGAAIRDLPRGEIVVATKCMGRVGEGPLMRGLSRKHMFDALDASLKRLKLDYVDLYQFHAPDDDTPIEESLRAMEDLVRSGRVRYVGFSNFDHQPSLAAKAVALQQRHEYLPFVSSQPRYNLLDRHVEQGHTAFCKKSCIGLIVYSPLAQGVLTNKYAGGARPEGSRATGTFAHFLESQKALTPEHVAAAERLGVWCAERGLAPASVALAWVLQNPQVSSAIIGASRVEQLDENVKALDVKLSPAEWREVSALTQTEKPKAAKSAPKAAAKKKATSKKR